MSKPIILASVFFMLLLNSAASNAAPQSDKGKPVNQHQFSQIDTNSDGYLSYDEFLKWHSHWLEWKFQHMDSDGDGYLTDNEFKFSGQKGRSEKSRKGSAGQGAPLK